MKTILIGKELFVKGWGICLDCDKRIKFCLRADLAIFSDGLFALCKDCYWESYADEDNKNQKMIIRRMT
jgi:hypothetical protein